MEIIILFIFLNFILNAFTNSSHRKREEQSKKSFTPKYNHEYRNNSKRNKYSNTWDSGRKTLASVLENVQKSLDEFEKEIDGSKSNSTLKRISDEIKTRKNKEEKTPFSKSSQNVPSHKKSHINSNNIPEDFSTMAAERLTPEVLMEYEESLYGDDEDDSLFEYDYEEIKSDLEDDKETVISEVFGGSEKSFNIRDGIIFHEILEKPKSLR